MEICVSVDEANYTIAQIGQRLIGSPRILDFVIPLGGGDDNFVSTVKLIAEKIKSDSERWSEQDGKRYTPNQYADIAISYWVSPYANRPIQVSGDGLMNVLERVSNTIIRELVQQLYSVPGPSTGGN